MKRNLRFARRRLVVAFAIAALVGSACNVGGGPPERTVLVDYGSDEFSTAFTDYFPGQIAVRQGDTVVFKQTWSGEPHSVTMGMLADRLGDAVAPYLKAFEEKGYAGLPQPEPKSVQAIDNQVRYMFTQKSGVAQNGAQPCFLDRGLPPNDPSKPCSPEQQRQPAFTGRQNWYNSGYIHYAGPTGNTFRVKIAPKATPGRYFFFCNNHGPFMSGFLVIKPKDSKIPSQDEVNRRARVEIERKASVLRNDFHLAQQQNLPIPPPFVDAVKGTGFSTVQQGDRTIFRGRFAGLSHNGLDDASITEFIPKNVRARVGEKVSWLLLTGGSQGHTISFNVPTYFPLFTIGKDGKVVRNQKLDQPAGGAPALPASATAGSGGPNNGPSKPALVDEGTWNGQGFFSSGLISPGTFANVSLRFSKAGSYKFACLVHPLMVGTLVVTP